MQMWGKQNCENQPRSGLNKVYCGFAVLYKIDLMK